MKIVFFLHTPAHVHLFRNTMLQLMRDQHVVKLIVRDYGPTTALLDQYGFKYDIYIKPTANKFFKLLQTPEYILKEYFLAKHYHPDILIGIGTDEPIVSFLLNKPCIIVNDTETTALQHKINRVFADAILTPSCFRKKLGVKQVYFSGYKELAYLHPNHFQPDHSIYQDLGLQASQRYLVLRFNAFDAFHDLGKKGFSFEDKIHLVNELAQYARVFISSEMPLPPVLQSYKLPIHPSRIHHVLYFADLLISDTQTLTTESAILGTPAVRCNNFVGLNDMGNFIELEQKYDLIYSFSNPEQALNKALYLIKQPDLKKQWALKRQKLLADKIDVTQFIVNFIEKYPRSVKKSVKVQPV